MLNNIVLFNIISSVNYVILVVNTTMLSNSGTVGIIVVFQILEGKQRVY